MSVPSAAPGDRFKLTLHYDGERFRGWQIQPGERTVQAEVEAALSRLLDRPTRVIAAGRTDAGVHATGQVVAVTVPSPRWTAPRLHRALNAVLPHDVWVASVETVSSQFHARYDAVARGYTYRVGTAPAARSPFLRRWCWPLGEPLDVAALGAAAERFAGDHSFRAFAKTGQPERGERCTVHRSAWFAWDDVGVEYRVVANRFLHHMVRTMVGTMVDVARGRRPADVIDQLLRNEPGVEASPPAPAAGLFLTRVYYDERDLEGDDAGVAARACVPDGVHPE